MSVVLETTYEGETFEVEVFHDGHIEFPDRDLRHEQAMAEFTDDESAVLRFYNLWKKSPTKVIFESLELPENSVPRLAADYAEHVLPICEHECPGDPRPRLAIEAVRKFIAGEIKRPALEQVLVAAAEAWVAEAAADSAAAAAWVAARVAVDAADAVEAAWAADVAARVASRAAARKASSDRHSQEWRQAYDAESAWQVRQFVNAMEAIGQGFDWPDMKVTP